MFSRLIVLALLTCLTCTAAHAGAEVLPAEQAFPLKATRAENGDVLLVFDTKPGYALYRNRITVSVPGESDRVVKVVKPDGVMHADEFLGPQEQYRGRTEIRVLVNDPWKPMKLHVRSQGCADVGFCYQPLNRTVSFP